MSANLNTLEAPRTTTPALKSGDGVKVEKAVTINCPLSTVYSFWRNLENLPLFMEHLVSVVSTTETDSHWTAQTPKGDQVAWDARIIDDKPDELIAWESLPGGDVETAGSVRFIPAAGNRGTVVKVSLKYAPTGSKVAKMFAKFFSRDAEKVIAQDLFQFKSLLETGEIPTIDGQPKGDEKRNYSL